MKTGFPAIFLSLVLVALSACSALSPAMTDQPSPTIQPSASPTSAPPTITSTHTQIPTTTPTSTLPPPTLTFTPSVTPIPTTTPIPRETQLSIFENLWSIVNDTYVYPDFNGLDWNAIHQEYREKISVGLINVQFYQAMEELIYSLGYEHSMFLNPQAQAEAEAEYEGSLDYVGIGILVSAVPERQRAVILSVFPNSPAEEAGLFPRDSILSVDGTPILDSSGFLQDIVRGPEGTTITVTVQSPVGEPYDVQVTRHRITGQVPVFHTLINTSEGKRIGYIVLVTFDDSTVDDQVADILREMTVGEPLDGLIIDNRLNGGGSSTVLEPILSYFTGGNLGSFIRRDENRPMYIERNEINGSSTVPLVVLIGSDTASFGEIFAGTLQDQQRAYLIGTNTEGNVEILWGYDLEDGSRLWLANETFRPYNHPEQDWEESGITPDLFVAGEFDEYTLDEDPAVNAAINYLTAR